MWPRPTNESCPVGMTGPHESILGRRIDRVLETVRTFRPTHFEVATGDVRLQATLVEVDEQTGRALSIRRLEIDRQEAQRLWTASSKQIDPGAAGSTSPEGPAPEHWLDPKR